MEQKKTAREMLAQIEKKYFRGVGFAKASLLKGDERRTWKLAQVERLLEKKNGSVPWAVYLSDEFWTADEGRTPMYECDPLLSLKEQQTLTKKEMNRLRLLLEIAGLCHDLALHFTFDLTEAFGIRKNDFRVSNKQLVEWLTTTEYERIAMHTAYIMKKLAINDYFNSHYQPAQDALAELYSSEYGLLLEPDNTKMPPRDYVRIIVDELLRIKRHWQRGRRLKLKANVVILHDEIYGVVPRQFDKGVLKAAQTLDDYMDREVFGQLIEGNDQHNADIMKRFADKLREVRSEYLAEGWLTDDSLAFGYLMAHAEWCGFGYLSEEDETL